MDWWPGRMLHLGVTLVALAVVAAWGVWIRRNEPIDSEPEPFIGVVGARGRPGWVDMEQFAPKKSSSLENSDADADLG